MADSQVQEIKERLNILDVARSYLPNLKKSGANYFTLCPFHHEKTPSFSINSDLGIYKCFGCGESGDVFTLIEKMEGVDFPKALEIAAKQAGVKLKRNFSAQDAKIHKQKQDILKLNALVCEYYNFILTKHKQGKKGRAYARKRKLTKELIERFKIGYAPRAYTNLIKFLKAKGHKVSDLIKWGLVVSSDGRVYDKFRSRLIFPLINQHDDIVGFSGRIIYQNSRAPKYLHSPQTLLFDKGKFLFGLNLAKSFIRKKDYAVFCEGQLDVISSFKTNVKNIVASLGTSLTNDQLKLAKRYSENIYFCFDNDLAGETALLRSSALAHIDGMKVKAITVPEGKDADELINKDPKEWQKVVKNAEPIIDHMIRRLYKRLDLSNLAAKEEFASIILPLISTLPKKIETAFYLHRVAVILNVDENVLEEEMEKLKQSNLPIPHVNTQKIKKVLESPVNVKEEYVLALAFQHIDFLKDVLDAVKPIYFSSPAAKSVLKKLKKYISEKKKFSLKNFVSNLEKIEVTFVQNLLLKNLDTSYELKDELLDEIQKITNFLEKNYLKNKIKRLKAQIEQAEIAEDSQGQKESLEKLMELTDRLGRVK